MKRALDLLSPQAAHVVQQYFQKRFCCDTGSEVLINKLQCLLRENE